MTKIEVKIVVDEMKAGKDYNTQGTGLVGLALPDFPYRKMVTKEEIVDFLRWQCEYIFCGGWDFEELSQCCELLRRKQVVMI